MSSPYRSEEMSLYQMVMRYESAYECVSELGELAIAQFEDINTAPNAFSRRYVGEVRRCEELERKLRYVEIETLKDNINVPIGYIPDTPNQKEINRVELALEKVENDLSEETESLAKMKHNLTDLIDMKHILKSAEFFFSRVDPDNFLGHPSADQETAALLEEGRRHKRHNDYLDIKVSFVLGIVPNAKVRGFELMLWRVCRGNALLRMYEIEDSSPRRSVFIIFFQGEVFLKRVKRICEGFHATLWHCPERAEDRKEMASKTDAAIADIKVVIARAKSERHRILLSSARSLARWWMMTRKMKAVYHVLNQCDTDVARSALIAKVWLPTNEFPRIHRALNMAVSSANATVAVLWTRLETTSDPPTYNNTNKFTNAFQVLVDSYGVASYRETNPTLFTIITFPFLFAVMFGDMGHGLIMTLFAARLVLGEKTFMDGREGSEIWKIMFGGRYIILLMGFFSMYTGLVYNDIFSISLNVFGSSWRSNLDFETLNGEKDLALDPNSTDYLQYPYPIGLDPAWQVAANKISFINTYKMKMAIILGFMQMVFGVFVSLGNYVYFRKYINIFCDFLPQIVFLTCIFGYLCLMMVIKWLTYGPMKPMEKSIHCAPQILITFINMVMFSHPVAEPHCSPTMFPYQGDIQRALLVIAMLTVPVMLFAKPIARLQRQRKRRQLLKANYFNMRRDRLDLLLRRPDVSETSLHVIEEPPSPIELETPPTPTGAKSTLKVSMPSVAEAVGDPKSAMRVHMTASTFTLAMTSESGQHTSADSNHEDGEGFGEIMIHQAIHTIEFVLGSVSHTASYLRLWALSLAHQQLSEVLWTMVLRRALIAGDFRNVGGVLTMVGFAMWTVLTVGVLVLMEGLSAFLHTLRLHWVEFQSKFYAGLGYRFQPFSFDDVLEQLEEDRREINII